MLSLVFDALLFASGPRVAELIFCCIDTVVVKTDVDYVM